MHVAVHEGKPWESFFPLLCRENCTFGSGDSPEVSERVAGRKAGQYLLYTRGTESNTVPSFLPVQDKIYRQAITAAGSGFMATLDAERFLSNVDSCLTEQVYEAVV